MVWVPKFQTQGGISGPPRHVSIYLNPEAVGSLTLNADPGWSFAAFKALGYNGSKALLSMLTVQLAWELRDTPIKVNLTFAASQRVYLRSTLGSIAQGFPNLVGNKPLHL